jgi:hypothetical protein
MSINQIVEQAAATLGLHYIYAYKKEAGVELDRALGYPCLVRYFNEVTQVATVAAGERITRSMLLYFADMQPVDAETATELDPLCEAMEAKALAFRKEAGKSGLQITVNRIERTFAQFDALTAGVVMDCSIQYTVRC